VSYHQDEIDRASKPEKTEITMKIVPATKQHPGRFLKRNPYGWWSEVTDEVARGKVSTCF
jgi:hypothetical protein